MNEEQLKKILHSDMKLWEAAQEEDGEKFLELPFGVGRVAISLEGIDDGAKRAAAVGSFGDYIRGRVADRISDEGITARVGSKAARAPVDEPVTDVDAAQDPMDRLKTLRQGRIEADQYIKSAAKEIAALTAYEEIMNASPDTETPQPVTDAALKIKD